MQTDHLSGVLLLAFGFKHIKVIWMWDGDGRDVGILGMYKSSWKCHSCRDLEGILTKYAESLRVPQGGYWARLCSPGVSYGNGVQFGFVLISIVKVKQLNVRSICSSADLSD